MFAVIYKAFIIPQKEARYQQLWHTLADYFIAHRGAIGSCLHKSHETHQDAHQWIAYSRWPDRATRDASWSSSSEDVANDLPPFIVDTITELKQCIDKDRPFKEICMDVIDDLLM